VNSNEVTGVSPAKKGVEEPKSEIIVCMMRYGFILKLMAVRLFEVMFVNVKILVALGDDPPSGRVDSTTLGSRPTNFRRIYQKAVEHRCATAPALNISFPNGPCADRDCQAVVRT
jgi:hypothetical protein